MKKKLIKAALRIVEIEKNLMKGGKISEYAKEFDEITKPLSVKDMMEIDAYITENHLLDKQETHLTK